MAPVDSTLFVHDVLRKFRNMTPARRDTAVVNGVFTQTTDDKVPPYHHYDEDMVIEAHRWIEPQGPFTYRMVEEMLLGLTVYLMEFSPPIECEVLVWQKIGTPSAYLAAMGFFSLIPGEDHSRSGGPSAGSISRNEAFAGLRMPGISNSTLNAS